MTKTTPSGTINNCPYCDAYTPPGGLPHICTKQITKPYCQADVVFFLMKRLGFDPIKDVRQQYELEQALDRAYDDGLLKARNAAMASRSHNEVPANIRKLLRGEYP